MSFSSSLTEESEQELVRRFVAGERDAGAALVREFTPLLRWCVSRYRRHMDREEALQEAVVGMLSHLASFDPTRARLSTFVTYMVAQHFFGLDRSKKRSERRDEAMLLLPEREPVRPDHVFEASDMVDVVRRMVARLPEQQAHVIGARFSEEEPTLEHVGVGMGLSRERVRQIEADGLRTIRKRLEKTKRGASPRGAM